MADDERRVEILDKTVCYDGFFRLERYRLRHSLFGGGWTRPLTRELFERGHAAAVLPYDPARDEVVLIEQFRIGALAEAGGPWLVEIVAGMIEPDEAPEAVARRETREEAGCEIRELLPIVRYLVSPGGTTEHLHLYLGLVSTAGVGGIHGVPEEGEDIRVQAVPFDTAVEWMQQGRVDSAAPIIALQWLMLNRERLRREYG
ncbi:ADP-ribose diphosphatase [Ectothiorhodospiraceae bacterium 2226]|nr:ADP-ribose diphosphatase [Ectothiorhodospiraceae bacterium 2226]